MLYNDPVAQPGQSAGLIRTEPARVLPFWINLRKPEVRSSNLRRITFTPSLQKIFQTVCLDWETSQRKIFRGPEFKSPQDHFI